MSVIKRALLKGALFSLLSIADGHTGTMMNNTSLTADQIALDAFIQAENKAFDAKCMFKGATAWGVFALTAVDLAKHGVFNIRQLKEWRKIIEAQEDAKEARKNGYHC